MPVRCLTPINFVENSRQAYTDAFMDAYIDAVYGQTPPRRYRSIASKGFIIDEARKPGIKYSVVMSKPDGAYKVNNSRQYTLNDIRDIMNEINFTYRRFS